MQTDDRTRVLFVDDEEGVRTSWGRYLAGKGFDVATASDGDQALLSLSERPPDVVISDYKMPGADGLLLLQHVKKMHPETPFIMLTGWGSDDIERKSRQMGAYGYLSKPVDPSMLTSMLTSAVQFRLQPKATDPGMKLQAATSETMAAGAVAVPAIAAAVAVPATELAVPAIQVELPALGRVRQAVKFGAMLVGAPLLGLAYVIFFPVIGFGALFYVVGEAAWDTVRKAKSARTAGA
jgi:DNA-binding response OmpR family regulator